jgi:hypothetical protein
LFFLRNLRIKREWILFSGPVPPAGLVFGGELKGTGKGFFPASRAADIEIFKVCGHGNFRFQEKLPECKSAATDEFGFPHGSCTPTKKGFP